MNTMQALFGNFQVESEIGWDIVNFTSYKKERTKVTSVMGSLQWNGAIFRRQVQLPHEASTVILSNEQWELLNNRRIELIDKKAEDGLSLAEKGELVRLQHVASTHVRRVAPLPFAALDAFEAELQRRGL